jgi:uncharacterized small protein (DUF1192 family)
MALDTDDLEPLRPKPTALELETLSVEELTRYIAELEAEIGRVKAAIAAKQDHRSSAETFFKK